MLEKLKSFLKEERGQGAIEYIMLAGGIIVAAVIIFVIYKQAAGTAGNQTKATINQTGQAINESVQRELEKL